MDTIQTNFKPLEALHNLERQRSQNLHNAASMVDSTITSIGKRAGRNSSMAHSLQKSNEATIANFVKQGRAIPSHLFTTRSQIQVLIDTQSANSKNHILKPLQRISKRLNRIALGLPPMGSEGKKNKNDIHSHAPEKTNLKKNQEYMNQAQNERNEHIAALARLTDTVSPASSYMLAGMIRS